MPDATLKNVPTACDAVTLEIVRGAVRAAPVSYTHLTLPTIYSV